MTTAVPEPSPPAPKPVAEPRLRLAYLDGLRALASCYVVVFHSVLGFSGSELSGSWRLLRRLSAFGHESVAIFIVLSGYCLMLPVARARPEQHTVQLGRFIWRRARRILPPYFVTLLASLVLLATVPALKAGASGTIWDDSLPGLELGPILSHVLLLHNWVPSWSVQINGPLWSVASEWQIYFFFPLLLLPVWRRFGMLGTLLVAAVLGYAPLLFAPGPAKSAIPWYLLLFTFGMAAAAIGFSDESLASKLRQRGAWRYLSAGLWGFCFAFGLGVGKIWFAYKPLTDVLVGLATACLLIHLTVCAISAGMTRSWLFELLSAKPLVAIGHFSYSLYLTHVPVMALCYFALLPLHLAPGPFALTLLGVSAAASLAVAYAFHLAFERPFMQTR